MKLILSFLFLLMAEWCLAQQNIIPSINIKNDSLQYLKLDKLDITVQVLGNIATTTLEMSFYNNTNRVLEGELNFPLAEGQTVSRFAMDVNGKLREGVVVEKEKGKQVFESVIRRRIDPGLLEMTQGNNFKARVYPIPPKGYKRIIVAYEHELQTANHHYQFLLPLPFKEKLTNFNVHVRIYGKEANPTLSKGECLKLKFEKDRANYVADFSKKNYLPPSQLAFQLPVEMENKSILSYNGAVDSVAYFYINLHPQKQSKEKAKPKKIAIFDDVSGSSRNRDLAKELDLLDYYMKWAENVEVQLYCFSNAVQTAQRFTISKGNWAELKNVMSHQPIDGGTQLGALDFSKTDCDEILLLSDGLSNFGKDRIKLSQTPVVVINSSTVADHSYLNFIAQSTSGTYLNLANLTLNDAQNAISKVNLRFLSAEYMADQIYDVLPSIPCEIGNSFSLAGKIRAKQGRIKLNFGYGKDVAYSEECQIDHENETGNNLTERIWVQKKIQELSYEPTKNKDEITALGKKHTVVTENTSLIVLDNVQDYVTHEIVPPVELQKEYFELLATKKATIQNAVNQKMDYVYGMFKSQVDWQAKDWVKIEKERIEQAKRDSIAAVQQSIEQEKNNKIKNQTIRKSKRINKKKKQLKYTYPMVVDSVPKEQVILNMDDFKGVSTNSNQSSNPIVIIEEKKEVVESHANKTTAVRTELHSSAIQIKAWEPNCAYLDSLKKKPTSGQYQQYLNLIDNYKDTPSFYLDVASFFFDQKDSLHAVQILSNLAELKLENHELLRILGRKLLEFGDVVDAIAVFKKVLEIRSFEPHSYRDLGLAYADNKEYQKAIETLYQAVTKEWSADINGRFSGIETIILAEMNNIIAKAGSAVHTEFIDKRFLINSPVDIRIVLNWDADNSDMDLWVTDPLNEKCFYGHNRTKQGGLMTRDMTRGYGPEEFTLTKAANGDYKIEVNYYGTSQQTIAGPVTIQVQLFTNYGRKNEERKQATVRLGGSKSVIEIGSLHFETKQ